MMNMKIFAIVTGVIAALVLAYFYAKSSRRFVAIEGFGGGGTLKMFTVDWCRFCKAFASEKEKIMTKSRQGKLDFAVESVDGDQVSKEELEKNKVSGFPTIVFVTSSGEVVKYEGERTADKIVAWASEL